MLEKHKNVHYKNVGPKNIAKFCKILTKMTRNAEEKNVVIFLKNVETFSIS
jgi:hypothetical protein